MAMVALGLALAFLVWVLLQTAGRRPAVVVTDPAAATAAAPGAPTDYSRILGRWLRPDGGYVLEFRKVGPDGRIDAGYFNPNPINVEVAKAEKAEDGIRVYVELRDANYDGNFYRLRYDPRADRLVGQYHQLTMQQVYDIEFERLSQP